MNPVSPKVSVGAGAAGSSAPIAIIVVWLVGLTGIVVPEAVAASIGSLVAAGAGFLAGYFQREHAAPPS